MSAEVKYNFDDAGTKKTVTLGKSIVPTGVAINIADLTYEAI